MNPAPSPVLIVVSGPSGAGKSTLVQRYVERHPETYLSISATTRAPRPAETDGVNYHFFAKAAFEEGIQSQDFLEFAKVHENYYGTPRQHVEEALAKGQDVILEIDVQGGAQVREARPDTVLCFLTPSSPEELVRRLKSRAQDSDEVIARRIRNAREEYRALESYDYRVVNDDLEQAYLDLRAVIQGARHALSRVNRKNLVETYTSGLKA